MLNLSLNMGEIKQYLKLALLYLLISIIFFWPMLGNITASVPGSGGDVFQSMWDLWWVPYSIFTLHRSPYFTSYVFYPTGANLATQTLAPIAGLVSVVFQWVGIAFAYNMIFLIGFVLSGLFAYLLAYHVTKNRYASFIAGFIYAFSPIHTIQAFGHLQFTNIEFIPLFLLFFLKMTEDKKHKYAAYAAVSFVLLTFMGDIEQGLMAMLLALFVIAYLLLAKSHRHKLLEKKFALHFLEMLALILVLGSPFFIGILSKLNSASLASVNVQAGTAYNELYSPDLFSFLIPSSLNGLLSPISHALAGINAPAPAEKTVYVGYTVLLLAAFAIAKDLKENLKTTGLFLLPLALFLLLSIGPYLQVSGKVTGIPGLYQLYHLLPFFNVLREPGRFDMVVELLLAILVAIGLVAAENKYANSSVKRYLPAIFLVVLVLEYNSWPIGQGMLSGMYTNVQMPVGYTKIGAFNGTFSMLILPALPNFNSTTPNLYPGLALYYQTAFKKPLVGGYTTRSNLTQLFSLTDMPLIDAAYYLQTGQGFVYGSPLAENHTNATIFLLGAYNVGFISVLKQAYNQTELQLVASYLCSFLGPCCEGSSACNPVYQDNYTMIFSTTGIVSKAGTTIIGFTPALISRPESIWQPGWVVCGTSQLCNATFDNMWFGVNPSYVNFYSPNYTRANISMHAMSPTGFGKEYVYFNNQRISILNLTPLLQRFTFNVGLNPGINQLVLVSAGRNVSGYSNIGVLNISLKKYP